jgi:3-phosphoshikimate 1-carboxyvinyltransferase
MAITLSHSSQIIKGEIHLTASKSESNRALIIQALCADVFEIDNLSISNDTIVLQELLIKSLQDVVVRATDENTDEASDNNLPTLSVNLAGTAMRFLTAYLAIQNKEVLLTGAQRMKERPIKVLVDVLKELGAEISYEENEGYPPLKIKGKKLFGEKVTIDGGISSQYVSALLMISPTLDKGLRIDFEGEIISKPYINMTIEMMRYFGAEVQWEENSIVVNAGNYKAIDFKVEADWSAASYWYSIVALAKEADITLYGLKQESLQGDAVVQEIYKTFGVATEFVEGGIRLTKSPIINNKISTLNFKDCPDIAQTVAVTCAALNVKVNLTGLKTLRIKETDRIAALKIELTKLGFSVDVEGDDILINSSLRTEQNGVKQSHDQNDRMTMFPFGSSQDEFIMTNVATYDDHRMAMAFAPLALKHSITIEDENVVAKSYPNFWKDLESIGFEM